ncbi:riboflavin transporter MCH5 [Colletotrichum cuscutae]|uniref:Riboflavin transporter MCH5 n=1 Tax=Colletotrichum cuscutae TaxID=1209917 RepID=A0AAI9V7R6_9PEZI|nr:riboflavin transporter MCH5 [Colletotrichum cuscutae]
MEERRDDKQELGTDKQTGLNSVMPHRSSNDHGSIEAFSSAPQHTLQTPKTALDTNDELHDDEIEYPDGGLQAWMVVVGAWCAMIPPMGIINTYQRRTDSTMVRISADTTPTYPEFYQMLLSFGVCGGISAAFLFNPALSAIGHWFNERRAFATGVACTAGGIGGIGFSLIIQYLAPRIGFPWAMRIIAFISTGSLVVTNLFLRKRLPPKRKAKALIDFRLLRDSKFGVTVVAVFFVEFAVFIPYSYISSYAIEKGLGLQKSFLLNVLLNAGAIPGRMLPGYIADRVGAFNTMCVTSLCCGVLILGLWLAAGDVDAKIMSFTTLFGFWSGAAISLSPVCISRVCKIEDYGKSTGMAYFIASFGALVGIPLAGFLLKTGTEPYRNLIIFAGAAYMVAFVAFCGARGIAGGWKPALF